MRLNSPEINGFRFKHCFAFLKGMLGFLTGFIGSRIDGTVLPKELQALRSKTVILIVDF